MRQLSAQVYQKRRFKILCTEADDGGTEVQMQTVGDERRLEECR